MAGTLIYDTIEDSSGNTMPTSTAIKGVAKAWVSFWGQTQGIRNSLNVSSITRVVQGQYRINYTTAYPDTDYAVVATSNDNGSGNGCLSIVGQILTTNVLIITINPASLGQYDASFVSVVIFK
jgi:hypothetical protein